MASWLHFTQLVILNPQEGIVFIKLNQRHIPDVNRGNILIKVYPIAMAQQFSDLNTINFFFAPPQVRLIVVPFPNRCFLPIFCKIYIIGFLVPPQRVCVLSFVHTVDGKVGLERENIIVFRAGEIAMSVIWASRGLTLKA